MSAQRVVKASAASACGPTRTRNEDIAILGAATVRDAVLDGEWHAATAARPFLVAVLDGLGGHQGGAEASRRVAERFARAAARWAPDCTLAELDVALHEGLADAHRELNDTGRRDAALTGMGTTCTALLFSSAGTLLMHVGDSRCYRRRDGLWKLLTQDQSIERVDDEGRRGSSLLFALGADLPMLPPEPVTDIGETVFAGDTYLLVTDGVINGRRRHRRPRCRLRGAGRVGAARSCAGEWWT